ncbi:MAG: NifU family protein [Bernardetiaceae bacterium]
MSIEERVERALDGIRPYLKTDGGDVKVIEITDDNIVRIELVGNCGSCPISLTTFKTGIESSILSAVPEVAAVEAVNMAWG